MFEDVLTMDQCERLVARLAETRSPFICAHGRPSLVPLLVLGSERVREGYHGGKRITDWEKWRQRMKTHVL
jgi:DNA mismatch repair protein MLH3